MHWDIVGKLQSRIHERFRLVLVWCLGLPILAFNFPTDITTDYLAATEEALSPAPSTMASVSAWKKPEAGWLYVLDSAGGREPSQILLVDPNQKKVMSTIRAGYDPDMALSRNGDLLCIASGHSWLSLIDTRSGKVLGEIPFEHRTMYPVLLAVSGLALAPGGERLYIRKMRSLDTGVDEHSVGLFDLKLRLFVGEVGPIPQCGVASLVPGPGSGELQVACHSAGTLHWFGVMNDGSVSNITSLELKPRGPSWGGREFRNPQDRAVLAFRSEDGRSITWLSGGGTFYQVDAHGTETKKQVGSPMVGQTLLERTATWSKANNRLFVGAAPIYRIQNETRTRGQANEIHVFDSRNWAHLTSIRTSRPFWTLAASNDGTRVYAPTGARNQAIVVIDVIGNREIASIEGIGQTPCLVIEAP